MGHYALHVTNSRSGPMQAFLSGLSVAAIRTTGCCEFVGMDSVRPMQVLLQDHTCYSRLLYTYCRAQSIHTKGSCESFTKLTQSSFKA